MEISPKVATAIDQFFAANDRPTVAAVLAQYGDAPHEREVERIHLLILKISRRDIERIRGLVTAAKGDYRDVIAWATQSTRRYIVGLLRNGPAAALGKFTSLLPSSIQQWKRDDSIVVGGLSPGTTNSEALVAADPAIQSGQLRFEFHALLAPAGLQVGIPTDYLDIDVR
jgi:hypothetical protein